MHLLLKPTQIIFHCFITAVHETTGSHQCNLLHSSVRRTRLRGGVSSPSLVESLNVCRTSEHNHHLLSCCLEAQEVVSSQCPAQWWRFKTSQFGLKTFKVSWEEAWGFGPSHKNQRVHFERGIMSKYAPVGFILRLSDVFYVGLGGRFFFATFINGVVIS